MKENQLSTMTADIKPQSQDTASCSYI